MHSHGLSSLHGIFQSFLFNVYLYDNDCLMIGFMQLGHVWSDIWSMSMIFLVCQQWYVFVSLWTGWYSCKCSARKRGAHMEFERNSEHLMASDPHSHRTPWQLIFLLHYLVSQRQNPLAVFDQCYLHAINKSEQLRVSIIWESVYFSDRFPCVRLCWWTPEAVLFAEIGTCKDHNYAL